VRPALDLAVTVGGAADPAVAARAAVEGILLARYRFSLHSTAGPAPLAAVTVITTDEGAHAAAQRGKALAGATALARDLANCPPAHLTAVRMAELAEELGAQRGLAVEVFDRDALLELGCGGLLAVNGGSAEPPRMIKLTYRPDGAARTWAWSARGSCTTPAGSASSPPTPSTP
jgi:leucyl aminopeptidase